MTKRVCKKARYTEEDVALEEGKRTYQDVEFQLKMDHIEYLNLLTCPASKKLPSFDLAKHKDLKGLSQHWLGYSGKQTRVLIPEWVTDGVVTLECKTKIFDQNWITFVKTNCQNQKLLISSDIRKNIQKYAHDSCFHPDDKIASVRRYYNRATNTCVWQGKTQANNIENISDDWFKLNIQYSFNNYFVRHLEYQLDIDVKENNNQPWVQLPVGATPLPSADNQEDETETDESMNKSNLFQFRFKQKDYTNVCTLINVINILDYMNDVESVNKLTPFLDEDTWDAFIEDNDEISDRPGYQLKAVMQLLQRS